MKPAKKLSEIKLLAAEIYGYSYTNYVNHRGNPRFDKYMPEDVKQLRRAINDKWTKNRIAKALEIPLEKVDSYLESYREAMDVVFAENAAESFRAGVKQSIQKALRNGLKSDEEVDDLVIQICYRAADLAYLLDCEGKRLSDYYDWLTREKGVSYSEIGLPDLK
jgi:predicted transcriptional regulator